MFITRRSQMPPFGTTFPEEENFRKALWRKEGPFGDVDASGVCSSLLSSSLSLRVYAAPKGLGISSFDIGEVAFGLGCNFMEDCEGGVDPEENLELILEIHEFLLPATERGVLL